MGLAPCQHFSMDRVQGLSVHLGIWNATIYEVVLCQLSEYHIIKSEQRVLLMYSSPKNKINKILLDLYIVKKAIC